MGCGLFIRENAAIDPRARCRAEAALVSAAGAQLFEGSPVTGLTNGAVETEHGVVRCEHVIVAVDGALTRLLPELAQRVRPTRLQMLASGPHEPGLLPYAISARWGWDYAQQLPDGVIAFGGCRDVDSGSRTSPDGPITDEVQYALERRFRELTGVDPIVTHRWASTVGYTESGLPILEEVRPGVWATGAYSGTGNLLGAVCGRIAARSALSLPFRNVLSEAS
jgi:glycine/D-amino acid oxidase-like deaminating enzyme